MTSYPAEVKGKSDPTVVISSSDVPCHILLLPRYTSGKTGLSGYFCWKASSRRLTPRCAAAAAAWEKKWNKYEQITSWSPKWWANGRQITANAVRKSVNNHEQWQRQTCQTVNIANTSQPIGLVSRIGVPQTWSSKLARSNSDSHTEEATSLVVSFVVLIVPKGLVGSLEIKSGRSES